MKSARLLMIAAVLLGGCATETPYDPLVDYEETNAPIILTAPRPVPGTFAPENREVVARGRYMVELLGCGRRAGVLGAVAMAQRLATRT